jgi:hypothetical protein
MNILTPAPVTVANHRGVTDHHITKRYHINTFKASALVGELPTGVTVKHKYRGLEYRYNVPIKLKHNNYHQVSTMCFWVNRAQHIEASGWVYREEDLKIFMDTFHLIHPIMRKLFNLDQPLMQAA